MSRLALLAALLPLAAGPLLAQTTVAAPPAGDPPSRVARVSDVTGTVSFQPSGDTTWSLVSVNYPLTTGDRLYADRGARAELQVGSFALRLSEATDLTVSNLGDQFAQFGLTEGTLRVTVYDLVPGDSIEIDTPRGAIALLAAGSYRIDAPADGSPMVVAVSSGTLEWTAGGVAQMVQGGQAITVSGINPIEVASTSLPAPDGFDQWSADRDHLLASSPSAQYVGRDIPGYADLDNSGTWQTDAEYGPVWYPAGVPDGWAPYRYGHWVWIEPWGWTWVEHEPWGYAPFHYGRWAYMRSRWGWLPGSMVARRYYAPALVVFVDGGQIQVGTQAWFPLGPGEPYHPWYHADAAYRATLNAHTYGRVANVPLHTRVTAIQYRNRRLAMTVVPTTTFQSGLPVARRIVPVTAAQIARAQVTPHPFAMPGRSAEAGGHALVPAPRIRRPTWHVAPAPRPAPAVLPRQPLIVRRSVPVVVPAAPGNRSVPAPSPVLVTRHAPPPPEPPFQERQGAVRPDAGRPLDPQQVQNLQRGKPAGPPHDTEFVPHPAVSPQTPQPRAQPAPRPATQPAPRPQPEQRPQAKPKPAQSGRRGPGN
jgi:Family of unknown function (DUF6600)